MLEACLPAAEERLREEGLSGEIYIFKNNTDSLGNTYGCHENFLMRRDVDFLESHRTIDPVFRHPAGVQRGRKSPESVRKTPIFHLSARSTYS